MAAKNSLKIYQENGYYHIYNRGVEKRDIFLDEQDYGVFLSYLKEYLLPKDEDQLQKRLSDPNISYKERDQILKLLKLNNFAGEIALLAYCLMPNHFHFLVRQNSFNSIDRFMNSLGVRYVRYFNTKYKRVGTLFQGVYKAVSVESDPQLLGLTSYIHRNPLGNNSYNTQSNFHQKIFSQPSSYPDYLGDRKTRWVHPEEILVFFSKDNHSLSYQSFVEQTEEILSVQNLVIDITDP